MRRILAVVIIIINFYPTQGQNKTPIDSNMVAYFAEQMLDPNVMIGAFEDPDFRQRPWHLKSGVLPQYDDNYLEVNILYSLIKLNTLSTIKGSFDSIVFIEQPFPNIDEEKPLQFYSYPGCKWILCMKSCYTPQGQPNKWLKKVKSLPNVKFLNKETAFYIADEFQGNINLVWNTGYEPGPSFQYASEALIRDLQLLQKTISTLPADHASASYKLAISKLDEIPQDEYGKAIARVLKLKLK
jgi:hypothetical protein